MWCETREEIPEETTFSLLRPRFRRAPFTFHAESLWFQELQLSLDDCLLALYLLLTSEAFVSITHICFQLPSDL